MILCNVNKFQKVEVRQRTKGKTQNRNQKEEGKAENRGQIAQTKIEEGKSTSMTATMMCL